MQKLLIFVIKCPYWLHKRQQMWLRVVFRPKSRGLYRPTIHIITVTFLRFFTFFWKSNKNVTFTFFASLHTFSRTMVDVDVFRIGRQVRELFRPTDHYNRPFKNSNSRHAKNVSFYSTHGSCVRAWWPHNHTSYPSVRAQCCIAAAIDSASPFRRRPSIDAVTNRQRHYFRRWSIECRTGRGALKTREGVEKAAQNNMCGKRGVID